MEGIRALAIDTSAYFSIPAYCIRQHTSAYVGGGAARMLLPLQTECRMRQQTRAYASIRQHTSAYVSKHEHTGTSAHVGGGAARLLLPLQAAYVSIRQHTCAPTLVHDFHSGRSKEG
jgi:hypothetical protein